MHILKQIKTKIGGSGGEAAINFVGLLRFFQKRCVFFEHLLSEKVCQSFREKTNEKYILVFESKFKQK